MSYIKDRIKSLYRLTVSNEKDHQFRSLVTLPEYAVLFSDPLKRQKLLNPEDPNEKPKLEKVEVEDYIRDVPDVSHVYKVDDSKNVTFYVSENDRKLLTEANEKGKKVRVCFSKASLEVGGDTVLGWLQKHNIWIPFLTRTVKFTTTVTPTFFEKKINKNYVTLKSSETIDGNKLPQILTLRHRHTITRPRYPVPKMGARVKIELVAG
jgi:hypothetical protein